jgi:hypothetical protein
MWPWGHLAVGYLCYATYTRYRYDEHPAGAPAMVLAIATQLPDLIDKPLAYQWAVLPGGRALAHSLLFAVPVWTLGLWLAWRTTGWRARASVAGVIGYATHLGADSLWNLLAGEFGELSFLLWPALPIPEYDTTSFEAHLDRLLDAVGSLDLASSFVAEWVLFALAVGLWLSHRSPPLPTVLAALRGQGDDAGS